MFWLCTHLGIRIILVQLIAFLVDVIKVRLGLSVDFGKQYDAFSLFSTHTLSLCLSFYLLASFAYVIVYFVWDAKNRCKESECFDDTLATKWEGIFSTVKAHFHRKRKSTHHLPRKRGLHDYWERIDERDDERKRQRKREKDIKEN